MRKNRQLQQGAVYHVSARINNKEMLLEEKQMKQLFQKTLIRAKSKFSFTIENFVIMGNHYHLIIRPQKNESLSKIMQWIMSVFAMNANKRLNRSGHIWGERFFSRILNTLRQYLLVFSYIDDNPKLAGLAQYNDIWEYSGKYHYKKGITSILGVFRPLFIEILSFWDDQNLLLPN